MGNSRADVWSLTLSFPRDQRQQWVADLFNDTVNSDFECLEMEMTFTNKLGGSVFTSRVLFFTCSGLARNHSDYSWAGFYNLRILSVYL